MWQIFFTGYKNSQELLFTVKFHCNTPPWQWGCELIRASWENFINVIKLISFLISQSVSFLWLWDGMEVFQRGRQQCLQRLNLPPCLKNPASYWSMPHPWLWLDGALLFPADTQANSSLTSNIKSPQGGSVSNCRDSIISWNSYFKRRNKMNKAFKSKELCWIEYKWSSTDQNK